MTDLHRLAKTYVEAKVGSPENVQNAQQGRRLDAEGVYEMRMTSKVDETAPKKIWLCASDELEGRLPKVVSE